MYSVLNFRDLCGLYTSAAKGGREVDALLTRCRGECIPRYRILVLDLEMDGWTFYAHEHHVRRQQLIERVVELLVSLL